MVISTTRARHLAAAMVGMLVLASGCTSDQGALPPPPTTPEPTEPSAGIAAGALLTENDLPAGFTATDIDPAERWADALDTTSQLLSLRPGCEEDLGRITATLSAVPPDAAGTAFRHDDGQEIVQFTGVATPEAGAALIDQIGALNASCDAYTLQMPERGSLAVSVEPVDYSELTAPPAVTATGWQTTVFSDHLRWTQQYVALSANGVVSFIAITGGDITGELPISEAALADLVTSTIERSEVAAQ